MDTNAKPWVFLGNFDGVVESGKIGQETHMSEDASLVGALDG